MFAFLNSDSAFDMNVRSFEREFRFMNIYSDSYYTGKTKRRIFPPVDYRIPDRCPPPTGKVKVKVKVRLSTGMDRLERKGGTGKVCARIQL